MARLERGETILAEATLHNGKWELFLADGRQSVPPHFISSFMAMREADKILKIEQLQ